MRINVSSKIIIAIFAVAVCVAGIVFFYRHLSHVGEEVDTDLFSLVPAEADAVLYASAEAAFPKCLSDRLVVPSVDGYDKLKLSYLLAHALCRLEKPDTELLLCEQADGSQLALCRLTAEEGRAVERLLREVDTYQPDSKSMDYAEKVISVSPLPDGDFLSSVQLTPCLWAASLQNRALKQLVQAFSEGTLSARPGVLRPISGDKDPWIWLRGDRLSALCRDLYTPETEQVWHAFRMSVVEHTLQLEGYEERADVAAASAESPFPAVSLTAYPDSLLPSSAWSYLHTPFAVSKKQFVNHTPQDRRFVDWFADHTLREHFICRFVPTDTLASTVVVGVPVSDMAETERTFRSWLRQCTGSADAKAFYYHKRSIYPLYRLPALGHRARTVYGCVER